MVARTIFTRNALAVQEPIVKWKNASIHRGGDLLLDRISFDLLPGEFVYLIGRTGSGKSSLIKALYGEWPVSGEEAGVAGFDLIRLKRHQIPSLRRQLGIIFQEFFLLREKTVYENLDFVLRATGWKKRTDRSDRIARVLGDTGLADKGFRYPAELSGGEQQRVAIARALLNQPRLLLADEPAGNLDPQTSDEITGMIRQLAREHGTAVLFATHDYRLIEHFPSPVLRCSGQSLVKLDRLPSHHRE